MDYYISIFLRHFINDLFILYNNSFQELCEVESSIKKLNTTSLLDLSMTKYIIEM